MQEKRLPGAQNPEVRCNKKFKNCRTHKMQVKQVHQIPGESSATIQYPHLIQPCLNKGCCDKEGKHSSEHQHPVARQLTALLR